MYRELLSIVIPTLGLAETMKRWNLISRELAEKPRRRERQSLS
jgi:hypothetical protein